MRSGTIDGSNGTYSGPSRILGPDGLPFARPTTDYAGDGNAIPHVLTFQALLGSSWKQYWPKLYDESRNVPSHDFHLVMWRQLHLQTILHERLRQAQSLRWHIEVEDEKDPYQKAVQEGLTKLVRETPGLKDHWRELHLAVWPGRSGSQVTWEWDTANLPAVQAAPILPGVPAMGTTPTLGKAPRRCLRMKSHQHVNGDKLLFKFDGTALLEVYSPECPKIPGLLFEPSMDGAYVAEIRGTWKNRFIIHKHLCLDADFFDYTAQDAINGVGLRSFLAWTEWLRQEWLAAVCSAAQRFGYGGIKLWYYPQGNAQALAEATKRAKDQTDRVNIMVPVVPGQQHPAIDVVDMQTSGIEVLLRLIEHVEYWQGRFVRGQSVSTSRSGERGGIGGGDIAEQNSDDQRNVTIEDAEGIADSLTGSARKCGLVWMLFSRTWPEMLDKMPCPKFVFDIEEPDTEGSLAAVKTFTEMGGEVVESEVRSMLGFSDPQPGDKCLGGQAALAAQQAAETGKPGEGGAPEPGEGGSPDKDGFRPSVSHYAFDPNQPRDDYGRWTATLGVAHGASKAEIQHAYRVKAFQHHPDRNPGDQEAAQRFKESHDAYVGLMGAESGDGEKPTVKPPEQHETFADEQERLAHREQFITEMASMPLDKLRGMKEQAAAALKAQLSGPASDPNRGKELDARADLETAHDDIARAMMREPTGSKDKIEAGGYKVMGPQMMNAFVRANNAKGTLNLQRMQATPVPGKRTWMQVRLGLSKSPVQTEDLGKSLKKYGFEVHQPFADKETFVVRVPGKPAGPPGVAGGTA